MCKLRDNFYTTTSCLIDKKTLIEYKYKEVKVEVFIEDTLLPLLGKDKTKELVNELISKSIKEQDDIE